MQKRDQQTVLNTRLHNAVERDQWLVAKLAIEQGAEVDSKITTENDAEFVNPLGYTALYNARSAAMAALLAL